MGGTPSRQELLPWSRVGVDIGEVRCDTVEARPSNQPKVNFVRGGKLKKKNEMTKLQKKNYTIKKWYWTLISTVLNGLGFLLTVTDSSGFQGHEIFSKFSLDQWSMIISHWKSCKGLAESRVEKMSSTVVHKDLYLIFPQHFSFHETSWKVFFVAIFSEKLQK